MTPKIKRKPASKAQNKIKIPQLNITGKIPVWCASREISGMFGKLPSRTTHAQIATVNKAGGPKTTIFAKIRLIMLFHYIQRIGPIGDHIQSVDLIKELVPVFSLWH